jgi:hypothetical protein
MSITRKLAKTSLLAGVAAIALVIGPPPSFKTTNSEFQLVSAAQAQTRVSVGIFYDRLAPHGRWVRHASHGYVFVPVGVGRNWRPYTQGRWVYSNACGWYWASDEPFGWATYRYGRWGYHRTMGWFWVPGNVWGCAWVTWRVGPDYVGWAPLAPERRGYAWGTPTRYRPAVAESWVFVETRYVTSPSLFQYVVPIVEIPVMLRQATQRVDVRIEQNIAINQPIEINQITEIAVEPMQTIEINFVDDPDQVSIQDDQATAFQVEIDEDEPEETPADAAESPEEFDGEAVLDETLDEVPEEAEAPSAAEVEDEPELDEPADEPVEEPVGETIDEPPAEEPADEPVEEPADEPVDEPADAVEEPVEEPADEPIDEPADAPVEEPVEEPADEPIDEPAEPEAPVEEPVDEPAEPDAPVEEPAEPAPEETEELRECPPEEEEC